MNLRQLESHEKMYLITCGWHEKRACGKDVWVPPSYLKLDVQHIERQDHALELQKDFDRQTHRQARGAFG